MIYDESGCTQTKFFSADVKMLTNINKYYDTIINILIKKIQDEQA